jgi:hypothetical protein
MGFMRVVSAGELHDRQPTPLVDVPVAAGDRAWIGRKVDSSARRRLIG